ncbi:uncharacterized protein LOC122624405 [Drosophila teissieri]|uniref:uncharacterized protein LOC122624405 n=1 Tax=Drosophila teissieri TaxID=7243 RepID=UPI001CB9EA9F|nr:uncharacterized protein LOC122624405 [Drosophila teissieri]
MESGFLDYWLFSNAPKGNFEGFFGFIRRITLMVYMGFDYVLDRQETHYDTTLVIGLTICAMGLFCCFVFVLMKVQKFQTLFCRTAVTQGELPECADAEDEEDKDEADEAKNEPPSSEDSSSTTSDSSIDMPLPRRPGIRAHRKKSPKQQHRHRELLNQFVQAADVQHCLFTYHERKKAEQQKARVQVGIRKIVTVYGKKYGYQYFTILDAPYMKALNKVLYARPKNAKKSRGTTKPSDEGTTKLSDEGGAPKPSPNI